MRAQVQIFALIAAAFFFSGCYTRNRTSRPEALLRAVVTTPIITNGASTIPVTFTPPEAAASDVTGYEIQVTQGGSVVYETQTSAGQRGVLGFFGLVSNTERTVELPPVFDEGSYAVTVFSVLWDGRKLGAGAELIVDKTPPSADLILGAEAGQGCNGAANVTNVSSRLIPFEYCGHDNLSGVAQVCVLSNSAGTPDAGDSCWEDVASLNQVAFVDHGHNDVTLFVKDRAGNIGSGRDDIEMDPGLAPQIEILSPSPSQITTAGWQPHEEHEIRWRVTDNDTPFEEIKVILSYVNANNSTDFGYLGCNFRNTREWRQCPEPSLEGSHGFRAEGGDIGSFEFRVPQSWDPGKQYLLMITAIDNSGNSFVASTQPLNVSYEVLAGKTWRGLGASGPNVDRYQGVFWIAYDKRGNIYDTTNNLRLSAVDKRSCRFAKPGGGASTPFDCENIVETAYSLHGSPWTYDAQKDVFYVMAYNPQALIEIDFKHRTSRALMTESGSALGASIVGAPVGDFSVKGADGYVYFDAVARRLLFFKSGMLYAIDTETGTLNYILGGSGEANPPEQADVAQSDLIIPFPVQSFLVTKDRRILFGGPKHPQSHNGSGRGMTYVLGSFSYENTSQPVSLQILTKNGGLGAGNEPTNYYVTQLSYDPSHDRVFMASGWHGVSVVNLPPLGSPADSYQFEWVTRYVTATGEKALFASSHSFLDTASVTLPVDFYMWSQSVIYAGSNVVLFNSRYTGSVFSLHLDRLNLERVIGNDIGSSAVTTGVNQSIEFPRSVDVANDGSVIFNDLWNIYRVTLDPSRNHELSLIGKAPSAGVFKYNSVTNELILGSRQTLTKFDLSGNLAPVHSTSPEQYAYDITMGFGNNFTELRWAYKSSIWNAASGTASKAFLVLSDFTGTVVAGGAQANPTAALLTHPDRLAVGERFCDDGSGNTVACPQAVPLGNSAYAATEYRMLTGAGSYNWYSSVGTIAFDANDENFYWCEGSRFAKYNRTSAEIRIFSAKDDRGNSVACQGPGTFEFTNGALHIGTNGKIYRFASDSNEIDLNGLAQLEPVAVAGSMPSGLLIHGFSIRNGFLYFTDGRSHRVFRIPLAS
ncbi:MAG: hypothetical protein KDD51_02545 [Bdellovibrionales bacterium]|nr:hypothetical protein [Bdellovibrionales bacterium]